MSEPLSFWCVVAGLGLAWHGLLILWVANLPHPLRGRPLPKAAAGSEAAFLIFWIEQYRWLGTLLALSGVVLVIVGALP
ncbi:MAG: hypothetical protein AAF918_11865 [Pseudomonadota bacterium]